MWIGAYVANYDKGGHQVSLSLEAHPNSRKRKERKRKPWTISLFNTLNVMEMSGQQYPRLFGNDTLAVLFEVPEGVSNLQPCQLCQRRTWRLERW
ncbi:MAG: hypothetical protein U5L09_06875 [Bacteroidales bacterium]|nr:hypothetical protein [Bacteroidales bacterium]